MTTRWYSEHPRLIADIPTVEDQVAIDKAVLEHELREHTLTPEERCRKHGCRWWRAGRGLIVDGEWIERPAVVMSKHETRR